MPGLRLGLKGLRLGARFRNSFPVADTFDGEVVMPGISSFPDCHCAPFHGLQPPEERRQSITPFPAMRSLPRRVGRVRSRTLFASFSVQTSKVAERSDHCEIQSRPRRAAESCSEKRDRTSRRQCCTKNAPREVRALRIARVVAQTVLLAYFTSDLSHCFSPLLNVGRYVDNRVISSCSLSFHVFIASRTRDLGVRPASILLP
jgi:hypothetical protein